MSTDYVTDVTCYRSFVGDLSPAKLRLVAAINGFPMPPGEDFDYCELGSAHGDTVSVLAASNPRARFIGVDVNAAHIASSHRLAREGKLDNLRFVERDFEELDHEPIPDLDFIAAHGVLSWIGPAKRKALVDFASRKLKPGGLLYVGYNALPGWSAVEPLRQLLLTGGAGAKDDTMERARLGFALAKHMHDAGAMYFTANPSATAMLKRMEELGLPYIAHEYLNANWTPMYFSQMARELSEADLYFVGQSTLYANYRDLAVPPVLAKLFEGISDRGMYESFKDFALNEFFRRDVFIKGRTGRSPEAVRAYFDSTSFGLLHSFPVPEFRLPHGTLTFEGPLFEALFATLAEGGAATESTLVAHPKLEAFGAENVRAALLRALLTERAAPMPSASRPFSEKESWRVGLDYNRMILRQGPRPEIPLVLASPITGTGVSISPLEVLAIRLLAEVPPSKWQEWIRDLFVQHAYRIVVGGRAVEGADEGVRLVLAEVTRFRRSRLRSFVEWGILE
ncbi:class I SAM-dependent methyltransferase [Pendulispora rubella]|uniref:Class I SAM-dependent methyltransferase n=1 Tax=Pendulispora rubella TaxID=2741070 RepID=A0ABZ2L7Z3_9BACT